MKTFHAIRDASPLKLDRLPTRTPPRYRSDDDYRDQLKSNQSELAEFQTRLYARRERALLIIFQGMDTSGKDGAIKHVLSGINPQGCHVVSFKKPSAEELDHDFLWRCSRALPARGQLGIFNRSYYEEVVVTHVHPELLEAQRLPAGPDQDAKFWHFRYRDISHFEKYLHRQGIEVVKIFLHISKGEQRTRLQDRFNDPQKTWKISESDLTERGYWDAYQAAYAACIRHTASKSSPWYVVPGDDKKNARLAISNILIERLTQMKLRAPETSPDQLKLLRKLKAKLKA